MLISSKSGIILNYVHLPLLLFFCELFVYLLTVVVSDFGVSSL